MGLDDWLAESLSWPGDLARPSVTLSYAQSIDGSIALRRGEPLALSGPESQQLTHQLRATHDSILVGIGTVLSDDPQLNVRLVKGRDPQIVVLDSQLRMPLEAKMLGGAKLRIFCVASASREKQRALEAEGAAVERQSYQNATRVNLYGMLGTLKEQGIKNVMVEGGGEVISSFMAENLIDRVIVTVAPKLVNGYKSPLATATDISIVGSNKYGEDTVIWGKSVPSAPAAAPLRAPRNDEKDRE